MHVEVQVPTRLERSMRDGRLRYTKKHHPSFAAMLERQQEVQAASAAAAADISAAGGTSAAGATGSSAAGYSWRICEGGATGPRQTPSSRQSRWICEEGQSDHPGGQREKVQLRACKSEVSEWVSHNLAVGSGIKMCSGDNRATSRDRELHKQLPRLPHTSVDSMCLYLHLQ
jgi:hypothetical protein